MPRRSIIFNIIFTPPCFINYSYLTNKTLLWYDIIQIRVITRGEYMKIYGDENNAFILKELGQRIKDIRVARSLTQKELSVQAGVSFSTIVRIENGEGVNIENLMRVMRVIGLLQNFELLVPEQELMPDEILKNKKKRKRVFKKADDNQNDWKWGDES